MGSKLEGDFALDSEALARNIARYVSSQVESPWPECQGLSTQQIPGQPGSPVPSGHGRGVMEYQGVNQGLCRRERHTENGDSLLQSFSGPSFQSNLHHI